MIYEDGDAAARRGDYATALKLLSPLAQKGLAGAQNNLGKMYLQGHGVAQDFMYVIGQGVRRDYVPAYMWFTLAAAGSDQGIAREAREAREARDNLAGMMTPEQIAKAQQLAREWKPTEPK